MSPWGRSYQCAKQRNDQEAVRLRVERSWLRGTILVVMNSPSSGSVMTIIVSKCTADGGATAYRTLGCGLLPGRRRPDESVMRKPSLHASIGRHGGVPYQNLHHGAGGACEARFVACARADAHHGARVSGLFLQFSQRRLLGRFACVNEAWWGQAPRCKELTSCTMHRDARRHLPGMRT